MERQNGPGCSRLAVIMHSGISAAALVAVVLNLAFNHIRAGNKPGASVFAAAPDERGNPVTADGHEHLTGQPAPRSDRSVAEH